MPLKLSDKDWEIISMLQSNPEISQATMARNLGLSQPSISARLKRLMESGVLALQAGVNLKKVDYYIAKIDLSVKSASNRLIKAFSRCPYCINGFITSGKHNLLFLFVCEDLNTLEAIVDSRLRALPEVTDVEFSIVLAPIKDFIVPIYSRLDAPDGESPCGASCKDCEMYIDNRCLGCPATEAYKGNLWRKTK